MIITIESTTKVVKLNGIDCRVWEGQTVSGVKVHCFIPRIAAKDDQDLSQFESELFPTFLCVISAGQAGSAVGATRPIIRDCRDSTSDDSVTRETENDP